MIARTVDVSLGEAAKQLTLTVRFKNYSWWMLRFRLGLALVRLGVRLTGVTLEEEREDDGPR